MKKVVYIFGAGASRDFGLPLGFEVFDSAHKLSKIKSDAASNAELKIAFRETEKHLKDVFAKIPKTKTDYPPFEEVLTFVWECRKAERFDYDKHKLITPFKTKHGAKELFQILAKMLALTLACSMETYTSQDRIKLFKRYIKSLLLRKETISFISLNYDTLLDNAICQCVADKIIDDFTYGVPLYDFSLPFDRLNIFKNKGCRENGVPLFKPHGSLNLVSCPHRQAHYGDGFYYSKDGLIAVKCEGERCPACGSHPKPLIIPPLYNKSDYIRANAVKFPTINFRSTAELYRTYLDPKIKKVLENAEEIVVIGYSMPAYDFDFKTLLITSLMKNKNRKRISLKIITGGNNSALLKKLVTQFEPFVGKVTIEGSDGFYNYLKKTENQLPI
jgi:hypothetical protein